MPGVRRAKWGLGVLAAALVLAAPASSEAPPGPRLFLVAWDPERFRTDLLSTDAAGGDVQTIIGGSMRGVVRPPILTPTGSAWPVDGNWVAFGGYNRKGRPQVYTASADGKNLRAVPHTRGAEYVAVSPDGRLLAFSRHRLRMPKIDPDDPFDALERTFSSRTVWVFDLHTGRQKQLTPWRNGWHTAPTSFSPDGLMLAASNYARGRPRAVGIDLATGRVRVLARNAQEPVFSPDGSRLALVSYRDGEMSENEEDEPVPAGELYVQSLLDGSMTRLTYTNAQEESTPSWDPSGERLAYTRTIGSEIGLFNLPNVVMQINADGTCSQLVYGRASPARAESLGYLGPTWQPGPGREAGRIEC